MASLGLRLPITIVFASTLLLTGSDRAFAQGSKMKSEYESVAEEDRDRPDLRAEWMRNGRTAPPGQSAAALRLRAHQQKMTMRAQRAAAASTARAQAAATQTGWVPLGPAPLESQSGTSSNYGLVTGRATAVAIDASDQTGNTVYLGGAYGGVWKSTNAANASAANVTWTPLTDQRESLATGAVSVKPDGSVVLVGTGEPNSAIDSYYGVGILRSADQGATWGKLISSSDSGAHPFAGLGFSKFAWSTVNTGTVVAAAATTAKGFEEGDLGSGTNLGLYLSTDSGQTWTYQAFADGSLPISVTDVVYNSGAGKFFAAVRYHGIYSSPDGTNWTRLANQPNPSALTTGACPANPYSTSCPLYRGQLAAVPGRNEMYFWFVDVVNSNMIDEGIWRSINGGNSWTQIADNGITNCGDSYGCGVNQAYYDLEIGAVPNPNGETDLYAGTINLYKCTLVSTADTSCLQGDWINLTHVYRCPDIANVHPDEHGLDFSVVNGTAIMYFANDGGIYRTLDEFTKLNSGSCGVANGFDDLNGTMGSMTQFVSFSIHPTDMNILLGGTQDNGSPATATATTSSSWQNANAGDGGYNAINPANPSQWFTENYGVSVQSCGAGTGCNFNGFQTVVSGTTLNGDLGAFYTPFILDPQNPSELLVGTCRVWRGNTGGSGYSTLSGNFDGTLGACAGYNGNETGLVRSLGAGGPKDGNGFSKVVYATTEGVGPYSTRTPPGGEVWITANAGTQTMSNVTGAINPSHYTISSVALDPSDSTGFTAYVGLMGFGGAHVFQTTNAGAAWTDWSGTDVTSLPNAPVNALLVDAPSRQIYAGTDVGVFVSSTSAAAWSEVGPAPALGVKGYLPNVPVSALRMFNSPGNQRLRASTYGRGIWEYILLAVPDFTNVISNSPQTVFSTQTAIFNGTLTALNGYSDAVNLSCTAGGTAPPPCTLNPTPPLTPTATYTVAAGGAVGNYSFNAHAVGNDANTSTHDAAAVLQVADLTAPSPGTVTAPQGLISNATTFQVTGGAGFSGTIGLSCSGLPAGAYPIFSPSNAVTPTQNVTLTVGTTGSTPQGSSTATITATAPGGATTTQAFTLQVTPPPDFTWTTSGNTSHTVLAGQTTLAYNFTATPTTGATFAADVTLGCSGLPDSTAVCVFNTGQTDPTKIKAGSGTTLVSLTITTKGPNTGTGNAVQHRADKRLPSLPPVLPIAGLLLAGLAGRKLSKRSAFAGLCVSLAVIALMLACGGGSSGGGGGGGSTPVAISPPKTVSVQLGGTHQFSANVAVNWAVTGGNTNGTIDSAGKYAAPGSGTTPENFTVTATSASDAADSDSATVNIQTVSVTVSPSTTQNLWPTSAGWPAQTYQFSGWAVNAANQAVTWAVTGGSANGSVDSTGLYTAPALPVPNPALVTITATSAADTNRSASGKVNIQTPTAPGTFNVTVTATEGMMAHSQGVTLTVQ